MAKPVSVFLSHSSKDVAIVEWIVNHARALGIEVYLAERDHQPGQTLATKILGRINASDAVIALITRDGGASAYVQQEIGAAIANSKPVVPLVEKDASRDALAMLDGVERINFERSALPEACEGLTKSLYELIQNQGAQKSSEVDLRVVLAVAAIALLLIMLYST